jgi:hypothetical protein
MFVVVDGLWYLECKQINRDLFLQCTKSAAPETLAWLYSRQIYTTINTKYIIQNNKT